MIRHVEDEFLLIPINYDTVDLDTAFVMSATGAFVFERCDGQHRVSEIIKLLCDAFEVSKEEATTDVLEFLDQISEDFLE